MAHISVQDLSFTYAGASKPALQKVSLDIPQGSFVVLFGKTGCGKTTLLRHLKTVLTPHGQREGKLLYGGELLELVDARTQAADIAFVMQDPDVQIVTDKVWHELAFGLENLGTDSQLMRMRVAELASYFGMQSWFNSDVAEISGGQKQLLALASALVMRPSVLVLDEPTSQLDPLSAAEFLNTVRKVHDEFGTTVVLSEHRLEEVYADADIVLALDGGQVLAKGSPQDVAAELLSSDHELALALPTPARVYYRVEDVQDSCALPLSVREGRSWLQKRAGFVQAGVHQGEPKPEQAGVDQAEPEPEMAQLSPGSQSIASAQPLKQAASLHAFEVHDLWFRYERDLPDVLAGTNFTIPVGQTYAFVGGNGVGKSTLLAILCAALKPHRGSIKLFGKKLDAWSKDELFFGNLALLPQDPSALFAQKTVREELEEMLECTSHDAPEHAIAEVSALCDIAHLHTMHPLDLSGGEAQRVALAKVLLCKPRVLLLDEPTKGIDATYKRALAQLFDQLKAQGCTIVLASHDLEFCARYADTVTLLFNGEVAASAPPATFFTQASYYTTAANRMCRGVFEGVVTEEDAVGLCRS